MTSVFDRSPAGGGGRFRRALVAFVALASTSVVGLSGAGDASGAPGDPIVELFYSPLSETDIKAAFTTMLGAPGTTMRSISSVTIGADNTTIYWDHWEDGYEANLTAPVQATTETYTRTAGQALFFDELITMPRNVSQIKHDGRDKVGATNAVTFTRGMWATVPGTVLTAGVPAYPVADWGTSYEVPVGTDVLADSMFEYVGAIVTAQAAATSVSVNGVVKAVLGEGQTYQINGGVKKGTLITATKPIQLHVSTGDIGANYEARWFAVPPTARWTSSYYTPVGTAGDGDSAFVFLYNPGAAAISVTAQTLTGSATIAVGSKAVVKYLMPKNSGGRFSTTGAPFYAFETVAANPTANNVHDWGFALVPEPMLTTALLAGWAPGSGDLSVNGSPLWITAVAPTTIYVDWDGNTATGALTAPNGMKYDVSFPLAAFASKLLFDADKNQTNARVFTTDGVKLTGAWGQDPAVSGPGNPYIDMGMTMLPYPTPTATKISNLVVDADSSGTVTPGDTIRFTITVINAGVVPIGSTTVEDIVPPGTTYVAATTTVGGSPIADNGSGTPFPLDAGGTTLAPMVGGETRAVTFNVLIDSASALATAGVFQVVNQATVSNLTVSKPQVVIPIQLPSIDPCGLTFTTSGGVTTTTFAESGTIYVKLDDSDVSLPVSITVVSSSGDSETITLANPSAGIFTGNVPSSPTAGAAVNDGTLKASANDTLTITFQDPKFLETCSATATVAPKTEDKPLYLSGPGQGMDRIDPAVALTPTLTSTPVTLTTKNTFVRDEFAAKLYSGNDGTVNWVGNWIETGDDASPTGGDLRADSDGRCSGGAGNCLSLAAKDLNDNFARTVNLTGVTSATISGTWATETAAGKADAVVLQVRPDASGAWTTIRTFLINGAPAVATTFSDPIPLAAISATTEVRLMVSVIDSTKKFFFDDIHVNWAAPTVLSSANVRDEFALKEYANNDGNEVWTSPWGEVIDGGDPGGGDIKVDGKPGCFGGLDFCLQVKTGTASAYIWRTANLAGSSGATITGTWAAESAAGRADTVVLGARPNSSASWTTVNTFAIAAAPTTATAFSFPLPAGVISATTEVRLFVGVKDANKVFWFDNIDITWPLTPTSTATFTQSPTMAAPLTLAGGGAVSAAIHVNVTSGSLPASPNVTAELKRGATSIMTLTNPTFAGGLLTFNGTLPANTSLAAGEALSVVVASGTPGVTFTVQYDSATFPSKITLPALAPITIDSVGIYSAAYPGGSVLSEAGNGQVVYLRVAASDVFGAADITGVVVSIPDPCGGGGAISTTLTAGNVVASDADSRTFEYVWATGPCVAAHTVTVTAKEGTENTVSRTSSLPFSLSATDTGTPSFTRFVTSTGADAPNYTSTAPGTVCIAVTDFDQNTNAAVVETVQVSLANGAGAPTTLTLTEWNLTTGVAAPNTGIFFGCSPASFPVGSALSASYTDPTDSTDKSSDAAPVIGVTPGVRVTKTLSTAAPTDDGIATVGQTISFDLLVTNSGATRLDTIPLSDAFPASLEFLSATIAPDSTTATSIAWTNVGPLASGASRVITVEYLVLAANASALNIATITNAVDENGATVSSSSSAGVTLTKPGILLSKTVSSPVFPATAKVGETITFTISIENTGTTPISTLPLVDSLPLCLAFVSATPTETSAAGDTITWDDVLAGTLAPGGTTTVSATFDVVSSCDSATNNASVIGAADDNGDAIPEARADQTFTALDPIDAIDDLDTTLWDANVVDSVATNDVFPVGTTFTAGALSVPTAGILTFNVDGSFTFDPDPSFAGIVTFPYTLCLPAPNGLVCDIATQSIAVGPNAVDDTDTVAHDVTLTDVVRTNDVYAVGSLFTSSGVLSNPSAGSLTFNPDGSFTFDPAPTFSGVVTFPYTVCLPAPNTTMCDSAVQTIVVGPDALNDSDTTPTDTNLVDSVALNDLYQSGSAFTAGSLSDLSSGSLTTFADGSFVFDPAPTFAGVVDFPYTVCLPAPNVTVCDNAVQTIVVAPNAVDDADATPTDTNVVDTVATGDVYPAGSVFTNGSLSTPAAGSLTFAADGAFTFDPSPTFAGVVTFPYTVCLPAPNALVCDTATQRIAVGPNAVDDSDVTGWDVTLVDSVAINDTYPAGSVFTNAALSDPSSGSLSFFPDGSFTFDPAATFAGVVTFSYLVCLPAPDGAICDTAVQTIVVAPDALGEVDSTPTDTDLTDSVATNDVYPVGSTFAAGALSDPSAGALTFDPNGGFTFNPDPAFAGVVTFDYTVCLPVPNDTVCDTATQTIVVGPNVVDDTDTTPWDTNLADTVVTNDVYPVGATFSEGPLSDPAAGSLTFDPDGSFTFDPDPSFTGVVSFTYTACLPAPDDTVCDSAIQTIVVGPQALDDSFSAPADTPVVDMASANDTYPTGSVFTNGPLSDPAAGVLTFGPDGSFTFDPDPSFAGTVTFPYTVCLPVPNDTLCDTATVTIVIGPDAADDTDTVLRDVTLTDSVAGNDVHPSGSSFTGGPLSDPSTGTLTFNPDGSFVFDPTLAFAGVVTFPYTVCLPAPNDTLCDTATQTIVVAPDAVDDSASTPFDTTLLETVDGNDFYPVGSVFTNGPLSDPAAGVLMFNPDGSFGFDPDVAFSGVVTFDYTVCLPAPNDTVCDTATQTVVVGPNALDDADTTPWDTNLDDTVVTNDVYPTASVFTAGALSDPATGTLSFNPDGSFTFDPDPAFAGVVTFPYTVCLPAPDDTVCDSAVQTITVAPDAIDDADTTPWDTNLVDTVVTNDVYAAGSVFGAGVLSDLASGTLSFDVDGNFTFDPAPTFSGIVTFPYTVCLPAPDDTVCDSAVQTIVVGPDAVDDFDTTPTDANLVDTVAANDVYAAGSVFTAGALSDPAVGTLVFNADGSFDFDPLPTFAGVVTFPYTVCLAAPNDSLCDTAVQTIVVGPDAVDDGDTTPTDTNLVDTVVSNDVYPAGSVFAAGALSDPAVGTLVFDADGSFDFDPLPTFAGVVTFPYTVCLALPNDTVCDTATQTIVIGPDAVDDADTTPTDTNLVDTVSANDTYPGGSVFSAGALSDPTTGVLVFNADGSFDFDPVPTFAGVVSFPYTVCLAAPNDTVCDAATQTIVVGPNAADDADTTPNDTNLVDTVVTNDVYPAGSVFTGGPLSDPATGTLVFDPDGSFVFDPAPTFSGVVTFPYTVCLPAPDDAICDTAVQTVIVAPGAVDDVDTTPWDTNLGDTVAANDVYPPGSVFTGGPLSDPTTGLLTLNADGSFVFDPAPTFAGTVTFPYEVCFAIAVDDWVCDTAVQTIVVGPNAVDDFDTTPTDTNLVDTVVTNDVYPAGSVFSGGPLSDPTTGLLTFDPDGSFTFDPTPTFAGVVTFPYTVCLPAPNDTVCDTAVQTIVVGPDAVDDFDTTPTDVDLVDSVAINDVYPAGSVFTEGPLSDPATGSLTFFADGSFVFNPTPTFAGVVTFPYTVCLPLPNDTVCDSATQTIVVGPDAADDFDTTPTDTNLVDTVVTNDVYPAGSVFSAGALSDPATGTLVFNADGTFDFDPVATFAGVVTFPYTVCLPSPNDTVCDTAVQTIVVGPDAVDDFDTTPTDTNLVDTVVTNDVYPAGSVFSEGALSDPTTGTLAFNPDGSFTFDPTPTFAGVVTFPYTVCLALPNDTVCDTAVQTIVVGPDAVGDLDTTPTDTNLVDKVATNDAYPVGSAFSAGALSDPAAGTLLFNPDGSFVFDPTPTFAGVVSFPYTLCLPTPNDTICDSAVQTIVIGPDVVDDIRTTPWDTNVVDTVVTNDVYPAGSLFAADPLSDPLAGTLTFNPDGTFTFDPDPAFSGVVSFPYTACLPAPNDTICDTAVQTIVVGPNASDDTYSSPSDVDVIDTVAANDVYPAGSVFAAGAPSDPLSGTLTFNPDGSFTFDPDPAFAGVVTFPYTVCLPAPNDTVCDPATATIVIGPDAVDDTDTVLRDVTLVDSVATNDVYPGGSVFAAGPLSDPSSGTLTFNPDGTFSFDPTLTFAGVVTFPYTVCLPAPDDTVCDAAVQTIIVTPDAIDDRALTPFDTTVVTSVAANDFAPAGSLFSAGALSDPSTGTLVFDPDGSFTFDPDPTFSGIVTFPYTVCLAAPNDTVCDSATATIVVGPDAVDDFDTTPADTNLVDTVVTNDVYPAGSVFSAGALSDPATGTLVFNADGSFDFDPVATFAGVVTFPYTVCLPSPDDSLCDSATQTIVVGPDAVDDFDTTPIDTNLVDTVVTNDVYPAGSVFSAGALSDPATGTLVFNADGSFDFDPLPSFAGVVTFPYTVCLAAPNDTVCDSAVQTIVVGPDAVDDFDTTPTDTNLVDTVVTNDVYPAGSVFTAGALSDPATGTLVFNADGSFDFDPVPTFAGVVTFPYTVCLASPNDTVCDSATQTIVVGPDAVDDFDTTPTDTNLVDTVVTNDVYPAGSVFTAGALSDPATGTLAFGSDGAFLFDPVATFAGVVTFPYTVCLPAPNDTVCDSATQTIVIGPDAVDDFDTTPIDTNLVDTVTSNDVYPTGSLFTAGALSDPAVGTLVFNPDGSFTFDPEPTFAGVVTFPYTVCLGAPNDTVCDTAVQTIVVGPEAIDDADTTPWDTTLVDTVVTNDTYPLGAVFAAGPLSDPAAGGLTFGPDGSFTFDPAPTFAGVVSFPYTVCLAAPDDTVCDPATQTIVVVPHAVGDPFTTPADTTVIDTVVTNDVFAAGSVFTPGPLDDPAAGVLTFNPDGSFVFDPAPSFAGVVTFPYTVCLAAPDDAVCDTATVTIVVAPSVNPDPDTTPWDTTLVDTVATNDVYAPGSSFTAGVLSEPAAGVLTFNPDGSFTFDPDPTFAGVVSFPYTVCLPVPNDTVCETAAQSIVVGPNAVDDADTTLTDVNLVDTVASNDVYPTGSLFTAGALSDPAVGTLVFNPDGSFTFDPEPTFAGVVSFPYTVCLGAPNDTVCDTAVQTIVVGPEAIDDADTTPWDTTLVDTVVTNDTYPLGAVFAAGPLSDPAAGGLTFGPDGSFTFDPAPTFAGVVSFPYTVCLAAPDDTVCDPATQTIVVVPHAVGDPFTTPADTTVIDTVVTNDVFAAGSVFTPGPLDDPAAGVLTFNPDGSFVFDPAPSFAGVVTFPYTVCLAAPDDAVCDTATVTIVVAPSVNPDPDTTPWDTTLVDTVATNDVYAPGSSFTAGVLSEPAAGVLTFNPDGSFTFDPDPTFAGVVSFPYTVCLPVPNDTVCETAAQSIVVGPNAVDDADTTLTDVNLVDTVASNDVYPTGSLFTAGALSDPAVGTLVFNPDGSFTFDPEPTFAGVVSFPYTVCLGAPNDTVCDTAVQTIVVGPEAIDDADTTPWDTTLVDTVVTNDTYPLGAVFSAGTLDNPAAGVLTFNPDGTFTFDPDPSFAGVVTFPYTVCLAAPNDTVCDTAVQTIVVTPDALDDSDTTLTDINLVDTVVTNDIYAAGSVFTAGPLSDPAVGALVFNPDGSFTFDPEPTFAGMVTFPYTVCLGAPNDTVCDTAMQTIVVGPEAIDDADTTPWDTNLVDSVASNDVAPAGSTFSSGPLSDPSAGGLTFNPDGSFTFDPAPDFAGTVTFPYTVCLPAPDDAVCDSAVQTIVVGPNAVGDIYSTPVDTNVVDTVGSNDVYPAGSVFTPGPLDNPAAGVLTFNPDGTFTFDPDPAFAGVVSFPYTVCLPAPDDTVCDTATATIVVSPSATPDPDVTPWDTTLTDTVATNDVYAPGSTFTAGPLSEPAAGTFTFAPDGSFVFDPAPDFVGTVGFPYTVCLPAPDDTVCATAIQTIIVGPGPVDDSDTTPVGVPLTDTVGSNDVYVPGSTFTTGPLSDPAAGTLTFNPDGTFTFAPDPAFAGVVSFPYTVCLPAPDGTVCATATQTIIVNGEIGDFVWLDLNGDGVQDAGEPGLGGVTVELRDAGGVVVATTTTDAAGAYLFTNVAAGDYFVAVLNTFGTFSPQGATTGSLDSDFDASGLAPVTVGAGGGRQSDIDAGIVGTASLAGAVVLDLAGDGPGGDSPLGGVTVSAVWAGPDGLFGTADDLVMGTATTAGDGSYSFADLPAGAFRVVVDPATLPADLAGSFDPDATLDSVGEVSLAIGEARTGVDFGYVGDGSISGTAFGDQDVDGALDPSEVGLGGLTVTLVWAGPDGTFGTPDDVTQTTLTASDGTYSFGHLPAGGYTVTVDSTPLGGLVSTNGGDQRSVTLGDAENRNKVDFGYGANLPPVAVADSATTDPGVSVTVDVLGNDSDPNANLDPSSLSIVGQPAHGTVFIDPVTHLMTYTPTPGYTGPDTLTYLICDTGMPTLQKGSIPFGPTGAPVVTVDASAAAPKCTQTTVDLVVRNNVPTVTGGGVSKPIVSNIKLDGTPAPLQLTDPEGNTVTITAIVGALPPGLTLKANGTWSGTATQVGTFDLTVTLCDNGTPVMCTDQEVTVVVTASGVIPTTGSDSFELIRIAVTLIVGGCLLLLGRRRPRRTHA